MIHTVYAGMRTVILTQKPSPSAKTVIWTKLGIRQMAGAMSASIGCTRVSLNSKNTSS